MTSSYTSTLALIAMLAVPAAARAQTQIEVSPGGNYKVTWSVEADKPAPDAWKIRVDGAVTSIPGGAGVREVLLPSAATDIRPDQSAATHLVEILACKTYPAPRNEQCLDPPDPVITLIVDVAHGRAIQITIVPVTPAASGARAKPRE